MHVIIKIFCTFFQGFEWKQTGRDQSVVLSRFGQPPYIVIYNFPENF